jgi:DNA-binding transcriptional LysR family regulator
MELREIEIFLALSEELHFGRTAERLRVSQARVSQTIKKVERQVGAPLFERTSRRVALTPIGRQLLADVGSGYRQIQAGIARASAAGRGVSGVLRVGFEAPGVADLISDVMDTFTKRHPDCETQIREVRFADPFGMLRDDEVDVLVTLLPAAESDLTTGPVVYTEPMVLAVTSKHPFARLDSVCLEDLGRDTVLRAAHPPEPYWVDPALPWTTAAGQPVRRGDPYATFQELLAAIAGGDGSCPLAAHATQYFAHPKVTFVPFRDGPPVQWGVVWRTAGETSRVREFAQAAREALVAQLR